MIILLLFSFLAGIVTVLSPCILPILPIVLSGAVGGKSKPFGIIAGFILSFTFFTLFLTTLVGFLNISSDTLRSLSILIIIVFGVSLLIPKFQEMLERFFTRLSGFLPKGGKKTGFLGGIAVGITIGVLWTPCVGPILASVISLAITGEVTGSALLITLAYSLGTGIPMLGIILGGRRVLGSVPFLAKNALKIQRLFGIIMVLTGIGIFYNFDRRVQTFILDKFPGYGVGLTRLEDNNFVSKNLRLLGGDEALPESIGKPMDVSDMNYITAPEIIPSGEWFGLPAGRQTLTLDELRGRVVLVDFWTYTCINCIRTFPYLNEWHKKYEELGLTIIGVHTPEFEFEKSPENLKKAIADFGINHPVVQDNEYKTWRAYANRYWPAKYLIDKKGKIRYTHFGEGKYDETEKMIQKLLEEDGEKVDIRINNIEYNISTRTPELYLGYERMGYFADPNQLVESEKINYQLPRDLVINHFAFEGNWLVGPESSQAFLGSELILAFDAREVFLVMRPKNTGRSARVEVFLDGKNIDGGFGGEDVNGGVVTVEKDRLYKIIKLQRSGQHLLRLKFLDDNTEIFAFTFG